MATTMPQRAVLAVVYDGQCGLCMRSVRLIKSLDRRRAFDYVDAQNRSVVTSRWPALDLDAILGQIHVVLPSGEVYIGYKAVRQIAAKLPVICFIAPVMGWPGIAWVGDKVYRWVAAHRYQFNRLMGKADICAGGTCQLPSASPRTKGQ